MLSSSSSVDAAAAGRGVPVVVLVAAAAATGGLHDALAAETTTLPFESKEADAADGDVLSQLRVSLSTIWFPQCSGPSATRPCPSTCFTNLS